MADYLLDTELFNLGVNYRQTYLDRLHRITREDLQRIARKRLRPENAIVVIVGGGVVTKTSRSDQGPSLGGHPVRASWPLGGPNE